MLTFKKKYFSVRIIQLLMYFLNIVNLKLSIGIYSI